MVATFSFDAAAKDTEGNQVGEGYMVNAGNLSVSTSYIKDGAQKYEDAVGFSLGGKAAGSYANYGQSTLSLYGKSTSFYVGGNWGTKLSLIFEADCVADTASILLHNDSNNTDIAKLEITKDDNIDIICVKDGYHGRFRSIWDMTWYKFSSVREQFVAKDAKVEKSGNTVTGKISVANNAESNVTALKNPSATVIMALYDAKGKMIDCGMSDATALPMRNGNDSTNGNNDTAKVQNAPTFVEIEATAEASDYAYAKFFVWDGTDTMNPFTEAVKVNAN